MALAFISVFGLILIAISGYGETSMRAARAYRGERAQTYAADSALDAAVNRVSKDASIGIDPEISPADPCNEANGEAIVEQPAAGDSPAVTVSCVVQPGSGSGEPADLGSALPYALLTLGDRQTDRNDGQPTSIGVRNTEPPPYNGNVATWFGGSDPCPGDRQEPGMRFNNTVWPGYTFFIFPVCAREPKTFAWNVRGNVFSNSKIVVDNANAVPTMVQDPDGGQGTIEARGGCVGTGFGGPGTATHCTDAGWSFGDGKGRDPGLVDPPAYAPRSIAGLTVQSVPPASQCTNARRLVTFSPGIYTSAKALNDLFGNASCKNATFWFQPGTYYFDFRNTDASYQCGSDGNFLFDSNLSQNTVHQWCVGGAGNDFGGQRVIGGTPYNWAPNADPVSRLLTLQPAGKAGDGPGIFWGLFPQPTQFVRGDGCTGGETVSSCASTIDGKTVNYAMAFGRTGSSVWMSDYPNVPRGSYNQGIDLEVAHAAVNPDRMNAPSIQVNYTSTGFAGLKVTGTCGPYTLPKPPASGAVETVKLSTANPAAALQLSACLNTGDRINSAVVQYNVNRPLFQGAPYATAKVDGVRILVRAQDQPTFPRQPSSVDSGGDCDPEGPGVQFIFGGDSRVYIPNGGFELCAGPNPADPLNGQQVAIYGVPAVPRLVPTTVTGGTNPNNAKQIAEGSGLVFASMSSGGSVNLSFAGYTVPSGYTISRVELRASFDSPGSAATAALQSSGGSTFSGSGCTQSASGSGMQVKSFDVTSCLTASNRIASAFGVRWTGGTCAGSNCPKLDGVELVVTLTPTDPNTTLRPQSGCVTSSPNLWYGVGTPDCSVVRVDGPIDTSGQLLGGIFGGIERRGRLSVKGAIYAPSASIDIDDEDVWYPIASRGIVARHLRLRGFAYHSGFNEPVFNSWLDKTAAARQVVLLACQQASGACTPESPDLIGRAAVTFAAESGLPSIEGWSVGRI